MSVYFRLPVPAAPVVHSATVAVVLIAVAPSGVTGSSTVRVTTWELIG